MTKTQAIYEAEVLILRGFVLREQAELSTGITVLTSRTKYGGKLEVESPHNGIGHNLTAKLEDACKGLLGIEIVKQPNGRIFVKKTGL